MVKTTCDGDIYIHNLSTFIQSHERQLANALVAYRKLNSKELSKNSQSQSSSSETPTTSKTTQSSSTTSQTDSSLKLNHSNDSNTLNDTTANYDENIKEISKPVRLSLSLHHLYFILGKFKDLGINVGPMNLRLDSLDSENSSNYVSFLSEFQRNKKIDSDSQSIHSISSVKSVMSSVSALWNTFGSSSKVDNSISDLKYLYSAFSKLPCLRLANEPNAKLIEGHEEYPFETATPVVVFKNILVLEISDLDPKEVYGWHLLANRLRYLVVKKANITDPLELLVTLVDADQRVRGEGDIFDDSELTDDEHNPDRLSKTKSNDSESDTFKTPHAISSMPMSHSSINLSSSLTNKISPNIIQSHSFASSYNQHSLNNYYSLNYPHNYNHHHYHHQSSNNINGNALNNQQLQPQQIQNQTAAGSEHNNNLYSFSTSPNASPLYYSNRLYPQEEMTYGSSAQSGIPSHSTRRSYYYKPQGKLPRRARGSSHVHSSSLTIKSNSGESISSNESHNKIAKKIDDHSRNSSMDDNEKWRTDPKRHTEYWKLLKHLSLTENKINRISLHSFDRLSNLTSLDLSHNKLTTLPSEPISKLVNLKSLNLSHNKLSSIEKLPKTLTKLTVLNLRSNKLTQLDAVENLANLQKIDLRRNLIAKVTDLKPLLQLNSNKVRLQAINLYGNPITKIKSYRVELFNLFNGVDYHNNIKIDGSRPGIFESRMLLDEKTSRMKFKNYIDESIISKMTASVSSMNLNHILNGSNNASNTSEQHNTAQPVTHENLEANHPVLDQMSTSINRSNESSTTLNSNATAVTQTNNKSLHNSISSIGPVANTVSNTNKSENPPIRRISQSPTIKSSLNLMTRSNSTLNITEKKKNNDKAATEAELPLDVLPPAVGCIISSSPSMPSARNTVSISLRNSNDFIPTDFMVPISKSGEQSQRTSNDFSATSSVLTAHTGNTNGTNGNDANPLSRLSLATPALPVITPATTTTMTTTNVSSPLESGNLHTRASLTPKSVSSRIDYFTAQKNDREENKENFEDEYSNLKIGVV